MPRLQIADDNQIETGENTIDKSGASSPMVPTDRNFHDISTVVRETMGPEETERDISPSPVKHVAMYAIQNKKKGPETKINTPLIQVNTKENGKD